MNDNIKEKNRALSNDLNKEVLKIQLRYDFGIVLIGFSALSFSIQFSNKSNDIYNILLILSWLSILFSEIVLAFRVHYIIKSLKLNINLIENKEDKSLINKYNKNNYCLSALFITYHVFIFIGFILFIIHKFINIL
ncbi:hypothetical protein [Fluviispira vulneris]|uniref:hypothetical protein n=1 Tax=Fluviispira vulneris TaxID=2763012 RepID=UPI001648DB1F|nr:hypothetical protein [Fluviispira vulneris]